MIFSLVLSYAIHGVLVIYFLVLIFKLFLNACHVPPDGLYILVAEAVPHVMSACMDACTTLCYWLSRSPKELETANLTEGTEQWFSSLCPCTRKKFHRLLQLLI